MKRKSREAAIRAAVARLDMSKEAQDILVDIWREVDGAYSEQVRDLKARLRDERRRHLGGSSCEPFYPPERQCATCRATDLRVKNWRKP